MKPANLKRGKMIILIISIQDPQWLSSNSLIQISIILNWVAYVFQKADGDAD